MAEHGAAHETHSHGAIGGDGADVEAVQAGDGLVEHAVAVEGAFGGQLVAAGFAAHQLAVARIGAQACAAVLKHLQAPLPLVVAERAEAPAAAHRGQLGSGLEAWAAGQRGEVLQQNIEGQ